MQTKSVILLLLLHLVPFTLFAQTETRETFRVVAWNVENLFDTKHDSLKLDQEFLPEAVRGWNYTRYQKKLSDLARTIVAAGEWEIPALVGLCEVENEAVLRDLTRYSPLKELDYRFIMTESADERGIDVALLYQRDKFKPLDVQHIRPDLGKGERPTRDLLHVSGIVPTMDTLDIFVAHFPSRSGGEKESEPKRLHVAALMKKAIDSLTQVRSNPKILLMGDFNDYPHNRSIREVLGASAPEGEVAPHTLYHLLSQKMEERSHSKNPDAVSGSYKYKGEWGLLDHLIVNGALLNPKSNFYTSEAKAEVLELPFLLTEDVKYGGVQPFRTYTGMRYQGGYSDHLPVRVDFEMVFEQAE